MNWLKRFMTGRYGLDQLSILVLVFSALLTLAGDVSKVPLVSLIGYVFWGVVIYRILSRNIAKRSQENYQFTKLVGPAYAWLKRTRYRLKDAKVHCYFICPKCRTRLRVPRGKGKIIITCPKCKAEFAQKT